MNIETIIPLIAGFAPDLAEKLYQYSKEGKFDKDDVQIWLMAQMLNQTNKVLDCVQANREDLAILKTRVKVR